MIKEFEGKSKEEIISIIKQNATEEVANILIARYGLEDGKEKTLLEVHEMFPKYTREHIRQMEQRFLNSLNS